MAPKEHAAYVFPVPIGALAVLAHILHNSEQLCAFIDHLWACLYDERV
jgi:hypothetical protein